MKMAPRGARRPRSPQSNSVTVTLGYSIKGALPHRAWRYRDVAEGTLYAGAIWSPGGPATQICPAHTQDVFKVVQTTSSAQVTRRGKHSLTSSHLRQARAPPWDSALQRHRFIWTSAADRSRFSGDHPQVCVLASISSKATPSHAPPSCTVGARGKPGRAAARTS